MPLTAPSYYGADDPVGVDALMPTGRCALATVLLVMLAVPAWAESANGGDGGCETVAWPQTRPFTAPPVRPYVRLEAFYPDPAEMPLGIGHIRPVENGL